MSQSRLFEHDVFLVDYLDNENRQEQKNLNCVCLLRPTSKNADFIAEEISSPKYQSYHLSKTNPAKCAYLNSITLVFTNAVRHAHMERIAEADEQEVIKDFQVNSSEFKEIC